MELFSLSPFALLLLVTLVTFAIIVYRKPLRGIYLIALLLPTYLIRFTVAGLPSTFLEIAILILFAAWLIKNGRFKRINWQLKLNSSNPIPPSFRLALALLVAAAFIATLLAPDQYHAFGILRAYFIEPIFFLIVFVYEVRDQKTALRVFYMLGLTCIFLSIVGLVQYLTGWGITNPFWAAAATRRASNIFKYPNAASLFAAPVVAFFIGWMLNEKRIFHKMIQTIFILSGLVVIYTARTQGAVIGLIASVFALLLVSKKTRMPALVCLCILAIGGALYFQTLPRVQTIKQNISANYLDLKSTSLEIRSNQWRETFAMLKDHPLRGGGLANYQYALSPYHKYNWLEIYLYPHNIFLNFWSELGILGLIAVIWLLVVILRSLIQLLNVGQTGVRAFAIALLLAWITFIVHGLVDVPYFKNDLSVEFMILVGATIVLSGQPYLRNN